MPTGIFLIKWDEVIGGTVYMRYPEPLEIPDPIVQQITISHNFTESYIITEEKQWNSVSYYNENKEMILVLVLSRPDDASDYIPPNSSLLEEFNKELDKEIVEDQLKIRLETLFKSSLDAFRTTESVITKLSNEVAQLRTKEYDYEVKFGVISNSDHLPVKSKILFLLAINDGLNFDEIKKKVKTSKKWLDTVLRTLIKNNIVGYNSSKDVYYIHF
jgi:DNA-binding transcriptional regulator GbsR (MarR family)